MERGRNRNEPAVGGKPRPERELPGRLQGDGGYESEPLRVLLRWLGITPRLGRRTRGQGSGPGKFRRFACALVCLRFVTP